MKLSSLFIAGTYAGDHHRNLKQHNQEKEETLSDLPPPNYEQENTEKYWRDLTRQQILESVAKTPNMKKAKNVILFIGDGMGYPSQTAGRILAGGEEYDTAIDKMPWSGSVKTYNIDHQTPDSAGTATAYLCGVKANFYTAGLSGEGKFKQCETAESSKVESVLKKSEKGWKRYWYCYNNKNKSCISIRSICTYQLSNVV